MKLLKTGVFFQVVRAKMQDEKGSDLNSIAVRLDEVMSDKERAMERFFDATTGTILSPIHESELCNKDKVELEYAGWKLEKYWLMPIDVEDLSPIEEQLSEKLKRKLRIQRESSTSKPFRY